MGRDSVLRGFSFALTLSLDGRLSVIGDRPKKRIKAREQARRADKQQPPETNT